MWETNNQTDNSSPNTEQKIDFNFGESENIFSDFAKSKEIKDDIEKIENTQKRTAFFYIKITTKALLTINTLIFFFLFFTSLYVYIQQSETKRNYGILSPICSLFLGDVAGKINGCYGVTPILQEQEQNFENNKKAVVTKLLPLVGEMYGVQNYVYSKRVSFLLEKADTRLMPLEILSNFDALKNEFAPVDKSEIICGNITLQDQQNISMDCSAYSADWETNIVTLKEGVISQASGGGTSISKANSFIYFLENAPNSQFTLISKPENFSVSDVSFGPYTKKTDFHLELQYNPTLSDLSL